MSKAPRGRRNAATKIMSPRIGAPYFAHDTLDPAIYPDYVRQPIGGPSPSIAHIEHEGDESDDAVPDDGSQADDESDNQVKTHRANKNTRSPASPLRDVKRIRVEGGRAPAPRRILADLDSDDELIVKMKEEKFTDKQIAARLREEGRVNYHYKTIGSRWARIKRALEKKNDQDLDDQLTDWHEGDDYVLLQAVTAADREVYRLKQAAQDKKWKFVSLRMKDMKPSTNYSKSACRSRFEALENDTATIPPELDDDLEHRAVQHEAAKKRAERNVAKRRVERAEESGNFRAANGTFKKTHAAVTETTRSESSIEITRSVSNSLPTNLVDLVSDEDSSLSDLDSTFGDSSAFSGDQVLSPGKSTGVLPVEVSTHASLDSLAVRSKEASTESLFSSVATINTLDPEPYTLQNKANQTSSKHQTTQLQRHSTKQDGTSSTRSEGKTVIEGTEHILKVTAFEESTESLRSTGGTPESRIASELPTVSESLRDSFKATCNHTDQCLPRVPSPSSPTTYGTSASVAGQQTPLPFVEEATSPSIAAQLLLELRSRDTVKEATNDQSNKRVETEQPLAMAAPTWSKDQLEIYLNTIKKEVLRDACRRLRLGIGQTRDGLIRQLLNIYGVGNSQDDPIFTQPSWPRWQRPDTVGILHHGFPANVATHVPQGSSANDPIHVPAPLSSETGPVGNVEPQQGGSRKRRKTNADLRAEGVDVIDFASDPGEQSDYRQRREEAPLPQIGFDFDPAIEYTEAVTARDRARRVSLAIDMSQRVGSGPPNRPRYQNDAPMGMLPQTTEQTNLSRPALGPPKTRHQLAPPLPSELNPSSFPTSEFNIALSRDFLRQQGFTVTRDSNAMLPPQRAAGDREAQVQVQTGYERRTFLPRSATVQPPDYTVSSNTASWQQGGANDFATTYTPTPHSYGVNDLTMGQFDASDPRLTFASISQGYGGNISNTGQYGANEFSSTSFTSPLREWAPNIANTEQSGTTTFRSATSLSPLRGWAPVIANTEQSGANIVRSTTSTSPLREWAPNIANTEQSGANIFRPTTSTSPLRDWAPNIANTEQFGATTFRSATSSSPLPGWAPDFPDREQSDVRSSTIHTPSFYGTNNPSPRDDANNPVIEPRRSSLATLTSSYHPTDPQFVDDDPTMDTQSQSYAMNNQMMVAAAGSDSVDLDSHGPVTSQNSSTLTGSVYYNHTMMDSPGPGYWVPDHLRPTRNVQDPTSQQQHGGQSQSHSRRRQTSAANAPAREIQIPGGSTMQVAGTAPSLASRGGRDRSGAPRRGDNTAMQAADAFTFDPYDEPSQGSSATMGTFGAVNRVAPTGRAADRFSVIVRNLPDSIGAMELQRAFRPYDSTGQSFDRNQRAATVWFEELFVADGAVLELDGKVLGG
ncbi:MAG: hypothetical protein LQ347_005306, partial [Umbilicaria vellea]